MPAVFGQPTYPTPTNQIAVTVGTTALQLIGANPARNGLVITNLHATQTLSVTNRQNATPASLAAGTITIPANTSVAFPSSTYPWVWTDVVNAIASGAGTPVTVTEF